MNQKFDHDANQPKSMRKEERLLIFKLFPKFKDRKPTRSYNSQVNTRTNTQSITILVKNHYAVAPTYKSNIIQKPHLWRDMNSKKQNLNNHQHKLSFIKVIINLALSCNYHQVYNLELGNEKGHPSFHIKKRPYF
jgi:hypothetical protein